MVRSGDPRVGFSMGIAVVWMIVAPHPLDTHITSCLYILKVFDILYMWLVVIDVPNTDTVMVLSGDPTVGLTLSIAFVRNDWGPPPSWNSNHIQSIHIIGNWYTLYVVSDHMVAAKHCCSMLAYWVPCVTTAWNWNTYETTMTWLRWGTNYEWTALPYYMYKKCLITFYCGWQT
jgi:hypothetical protein